MSKEMEISRRALLGMGGAAALGGAAVLGSPLRAFADIATGMPDASSVKVEKDVVVGKAGAGDLKVDIYRPPSSTEKHMALIHMHGGGFAGGSKNIPSQVTPITARGYLSMSLDYRLSGVAKWPAQNEDVKTAIGWTRENAAMLGIDPKKIGVVGYSAGGLLALYAGGDPDNMLAAVVGFYSVATLPKDAAYTTALLPAGFDDAALQAATPINKIKAGYPPTILYHGLADTTVSPDSSLHVLQLLRDAKVSSELHTFAGVPHAFDGNNPEFAQTCAMLTDFFLDRYVVNPRTYAGFGAGRGGAGGGQRPAEGGAAPAGRGPGA
jgi:acetyl esterase/lipase